MDTVKAKDIKLNEWETFLSQTLRALQPGIIVDTVEEFRAYISILKTAQNYCQYGFERDITVWSAVGCHTIPVARAGDKGEVKRLPLPKALLDFRDATIKVKCIDPDGIEKIVDAPKPGILLICDGGPMFRNDPVAVRALRETLIGCRGTKKTVILLGKNHKLPETVMADLMTLDFNLPDQEQLGDALKGRVNEINEKRKDPSKLFKPSKAVLKALARACGGLSESEARNLVTHAMVRYKTLDDRAVSLALKEKAQIVKRDGILEVIEPKVNMEDIGGLENLKKWLTSVQRLVENPKDARDYGLEIPSGLLLVGIPGCGKSYTVEALAKLWKLPLFRFDVGAAFGGLVGESEKNVRKVIQTIDAVRPCICWIDEIEKALGGGGDDGGTTSRVKQTLLTWMQDKSDDIFIAATANDLTKLEQTPELIRAGRIDATFFLDLPSLRDRIAILAIHAKLSGHPVDPEELVLLGEKTQGFSGAELKRIIQTGVREAFQTDPRPEHPTMQMYAQAAEQQKPLSVTMSESIKRLGAWVEEGRAELAGVKTDSRPGQGGIEQDAQSFKELGMPVI